MMKKTKILAGALAAATLLTSSAMLTGCGKKTAASGPEYVYVPQYITAKGDFTNGVQNLCFAGDKFYFSSVSYPGQTSAANAAASSVSTPASGTSIDYSSPTTSIYSLALDGTTKKLDVYKQSAMPAGKEGSVNLMDFDADSKGDMCFAEETYTYHFEIPEGKTVSDADKWNYQVTDADVYALTIFDASGKKTGSVSVSDIDSDGGYVNDIKYGEDGNIYVAVNQTGAVLDNTGKVLYKAKTTGYVNGLVKLPDGTMALMDYTEKGSPELQAFDSGTKAFKKLCDMPTGSDSLYAGNKDSGAYYTSGAYLFGLNTSTGAAAKVLNWVSSDINSDQIAGLGFTSDGKIVCVTNNWDDSSGGASSVELATLTKTKASSIDKKTVLTMATQYLDYDVKGQIIKFNKTNPDYRIEVLDYSEYNTKDDASAGLKKMNTEILSGDVPDIIYMNGVNQEQYAAKGLLEDLKPYMDKDSEVKTDSIMPNVLAAMESDGKIYSTCTTFGINTVIGPSSLVGDKPGWTVDQLLAAYKKMPDGATIFDEGTTRADVLATCLSMDMNDYVNWGKKQCSFDSDGFKKLLEFAKSFPESFDWSKYQNGDEQMESSASRIASGKQMLLRANMYDFSDYQYNVLTFSGKATFIGYPTASGVGNTLNLTPGFAIGSKCANKDGAWQFVRTFMTEKYQEGGSVYGFPTNKAAFDKKLKDAMTPQYQTDENGKPVLDAKGNKTEMPRGGMSVEGGKEVSFYALKQSEADALMSIINATTKCSVSDESISKIITDESAGFFSGSKSADETAKLIQSRVSIYINEQS